MERDEVLMYDDTYNNKFEILPAKNGIPTLKIGSYFVHSLYDPLKEAQRLAEYHYKEGYFHILIGLGLGYLANNLFSKFNKNDYLLVIEPNEEIYSVASGSHEMKKMINSNQVFFCIGRELPELKNLLSFLIDKGYYNKVKIIETPNYNRVYPDLLSEINVKLKEISMFKLIEINTFHYFAYLWQENMFMNLYQAKNAIPFNSLKNKLTCPVIIVSGGPSLTKQIPLLKDLQDTAFILCAGSAINSLLREKITPHAIVTVDGGEGNYRHFYSQDLNTIPIMYSPTVHREILRHHNGIQVVFNDNPRLTGWISKYFGQDVGMVKSGDSVANYCLDIAFQITSGPICLIGQDLAYTNNQTHAVGNKNYRMITQEEIESDRRYTFTRGYFGEEVLTDYVFLGMKKTFESIVANYRECGDCRSIINATEGGVYIEGFENMSFKDFILKYCQEDASKEIREIFLQKNISIDNKKTLDFLEKEAKKLHKIIKLSKEACRVFEDSISPRISSKSILKLDNIDKELKLLFKDDMMYYILQPVIFRVENRYPANDNETPDEFKERVLKISRTLYKDILETTKHTKKYLDQLIENLKTC